MPKNRDIDEDDFGHLDLLPNVPVPPERPDDEEFSLLPLAVQRYLLYLEGAKGSYEQEGMIGMYFSLNYQLNNLSKEIRQAAITFSNNRDDKIFERFLAVNKELRTMMENIEWLKQKLGIKEGEKEEDVKLRRSPIENRAR